MKRHGFIIRGAVWAIVCGALMAAPVFAQLNNSLEYGTAYPIQDEFGNLLPSSVSNPGALVHILRWQQDVGIVPPDLDGTPSPNNPIIHIAYIGEGTIGDGAGSFDGIITPLNRAETHTMFARVYNRRNLEDASFYGNSQVYTARPDATGEQNIFYIEIPRTNIEIDPNDDDDDGLSNSWERSLGTDPLNPDTDGDGISDFHEFLAGTDPLDPLDFMQIVDIQRMDGPDIILQWSSVTGRMYQVEYTTNSLIDEVVNFISLYDPVTAEAAETSIIFTNGALFEVPHFRVRLAPE